MKICPICRARFDDDLNYCLNDGTTLKDFEAFDAEETVSMTDGATLEFAKPFAGRGAASPTAFGHSPQTARRLKTPAILIGVFGLILSLFGAATVGGMLYFRHRATVAADRQPTFASDESLTILPGETPDPKGSLKAEILGEIEKDGNRYLKCKITNVGATVVRSPLLTLLFYQNDVKINEAAEWSNLEYLKPGQSVPVWIESPDAEKYTSVKVKEPVHSLANFKTEQQIFPSLAFTETEMKPQSSARNDKAVFVRGIVENQNYGEMLSSLYVVFYDEKSEIIGISKTLVSLQKGEKAKFEVAAGERDLFGTPKSFEIIAVAN